MTEPKRDLVQVAAERSGASVPTTRTEMRKEISRLVQRKMSGSERVKVRQWAGRVERTDDELAEKLAELLAMGDLAW